MPKKGTVLSMFLASPGDVKQERRIAREVITSLDEDIWVSRNVCLRILRWEDAPSGLGDPQSLINEYSENADLVVVIFNRRFGSPTASYQSGTIEEFEIAKAKWESRGTPRVKIFFRELDAATLKDPGEEVRKVIDFRKKFWDQRLGLYVDYKNPRDFENKFRSEIYKWLDEVTLNPDSATLRRAGGGLPAPIRPFIGRDDEVKGILDLIRQNGVQAVTLFGIAGVGKSSLAVHAAAGLKGEYGSGLFYIDMGASTTDDVICDIAEKIGVRIAKGVDLLKSVTENLRDSRTLLLLDNCDKMPATTPQLALLLREVPSLKVLITSREPLELDVQNKREVQPLASYRQKKMDGTTVKDALRDYPALDLFEKLMQQKNPAFRLTEKNIRMVAEICSQLDGLPLAIKLAVDGMGLLPLSEKSSELKILRRGRGQLAAAFTSSYSKLTSGEKTVFRRLSIFAGGLMPEAAQAVCGPGGEGGDVMADLVSLINRGLLQAKEQPWGAPRLVMLNTIREFARGCLLDEEDEEGRLALSRRHAAFYLERAEEAEPKLTSGEREASGWLERLDMESGNLNSALEWSLSQEGDAVMGLRLVGALFWFWNLQGSLEEGRRWAEAAMQRGGDLADGVVKAKALYCLGALCFMQGDYERAQEMLGRSVEMWRTIPGRERELGFALIVRGMTLLQQDKQKTGPEALSCEEEALRIFEKSGDEWGHALALNDLGNVKKEDAKYEEALARYGEALDKWEQLKDSWGRALTRSNMGETAYRNADYGKARRLIREALKIQRERGDKWGIAWSLNMLGRVDAKHPDYEQAEAHFRESLSLHRELGRKHMIACCLEGLAGVAVLANEDGRRASVLFAAASSLRKSIDAAMTSDEKLEYERGVEAINKRMDNLSVEAAQAQAEKMSLEEVVEYAMAT